MKARITGHRMTLEDQSWVHWQAVIIDPVTHRVVWQDDCRDLAALIDEAEAFAGAFSMLARIGQRFRPWVEIVAEAGRHL